MAVELLQTRVFTSFGSVIAAPPGLILSGLQRRVDQHVHTMTSFLVYGTDLWGALHPFSRGARWPRFRGDAGLKATEDGTLRVFRDSRLRLKIF